MLPRRGTLEFKIINFIIQTFLPHARHLLYAGVPVHRSGL
ncbi:hypothetical protein GXM_08603 [Nostoc sphaeroides CCNUC1]|uniref:Uncharacterized protein n=1 Tax=Nostoc sphaeroides CCNUC1 TaxID=2653204 RepID=A0A5P8WH22_9NOSO|nr:hypothetical protein GXM_08603 [Nostoc sphaeroides CCNUC1]